ncbi:hypothetical protein Tco_0475326 [Tanacetum coccineum]
METQKPLLKDEDGEEVDVHMYRSMIGSLMYLTSSRTDIMFTVCACAKYQVNPKVTHLHAVKRIFSDYVGASLDRKSTTGGCQFLGCRLISWQCKKQKVVANSITEAEYVAASSCYGQLYLMLLDTHNLVAFLSKPAESEGFEQIVDFLNANPIKYALTVNPTIYISCIEQFWSTVKAKTINGEVQLHALVDGKKIIVTESSVRRDLQLEDAEDEVVHKELGDSLVRAATIASSLEAEQDNGNTLRSDEDRLKLNELMELCTTLQTRVLDLEKTKTSQHNEIPILKRRIKKLEKKRSSRTHKLKRLYKVGLSVKVESSGNEENLGEDASKQGRRINAIDADEDITLVNVQDDADNEMFDVNALNGEEVFFAGKNENVVEEVVDAAQVSTAATTITITTEELTLTQVLEALKTSKPKVKGVVIQELAKIDANNQLTVRWQAQEQEELSDAEKATLFQQLLEKRRKHFAAKRAEEKINKPPTQAQQRNIMCTYLKNIEGYKLKDLKSKGAGGRKRKKSRRRADTREFKEAKGEDNKEIVELKQCMEIIPGEEEVTIDAIHLAVKSLRIVDWKIHKEGKKSYYQIIRADGKSQMYMIFSQMIKSFDLEDLEDLYKLVKARYGSTRPVESMDSLLWNDIKIMFEPHVEDEVWKLQNGYKVLEWKLYDSCGVHFLRMQSMQIYMLVEKKYPLTPPTLSMMLEKKLQIDYESEMAYQLCKLIMKQLKK